MFVRLVARMPTIMAQLFGFKDAVYVYDHFDVSEFVVESDERLDQTVVFSHYICEGIGQSPFFIATKRDQDFGAVFELDDFIELSTRTSSQALRSSSGSGTRFSASNTKCARAGRGTAPSTARCYSWQRKPGRSSFSTRRASRSTRRPLTRPGGRF
jgi:hypothetical protein